MPLPRIASLQPSISVTMAALDRLDQLVACTKYCLAQVPELAGRDLVVLEDSWNFGDAETARLRETVAELVMASVPYRTQSLEAILRAGMAVVAFSPRSLADIYADTRTTAALLDARDSAEQMIAAFEQELERTRAAVAGRSLTVYCEEWGKPLIHSQPWVYELAAAAGMRDVGTPGAQTTADDISVANPDAIVMAWCGAGDRVPIARVVEQRGWQHLRAVRDGRIVCIADEWLNTPALPSLTEGLRALAKANAGPSLRSG